MNPLKHFKRIFTKKPDPLDNLLIEKGIDPDQLMEDIYYQRQEEGNSNAINRALERHEVQREKGEKAAKKARDAIHGHF